MKPELLFRVAGCRSHIDDDDSNPKNSWNVPKENDSKVFTFMRKKGIIVTSVLKGNHCVLILVSSLCTKLENLLFSILSNIFCILTNESYDTEITKREI